MKARSSTRSRDIAIMTKATSIPDSYQIAYR